jgi:DNA-binding NarL/FixJ family response regulator
VTGRRVSFAPVGLTRREVDVLRVLARDGQCNEAIAVELGVSVWTVRRHLATSFPKLGARTRTEAALMAVRQGIV